MEMMTGTRMSPMEKKCDQFQMDKFEKTASAFFRDIFDLDMQGWILTDESELDDFSSFGIPDEDFAAMHCADNDYVSWDAWIIGKIQRTYGVEIRSTKMYLVRIFDLIEQHRSKPVH